MSMSLILINFKQNGTRKSHENSTQHSYKAQVWNM